jgi:hypothetical protein
MPRRAISPGRSPLAPTWALANSRSTLLRDDFHPDPPGSRPHPRAGHPRIPARAAGLAARAREVIECALKTYPHAVARAEARGEDPPSFLDVLHRYARPDRDAPGAPPGPVTDAYTLYMSRIQARDIGSVRLHSVVVNALRLYIVRATTDGDDGYIELYDARGTLLAAGATLVDQVRWISRQSLRGALPPPEIEP